MKLSEKMLILKATSAMRKLADRSGKDPEDDHLAADGILLDLLTELGAKEIKDEFNRIKKWYA